MTTAESTPTESMVTMPGLVITSDNEGDAIEIAASLYLLDNELRPESEWDPLPAHLTAEDIVAAKRRLERRRKEVRLGAAMAEQLPQPRIRQQFICITLGCHAVSDRPGACGDCLRRIERGEFDRSRRMRWFAWSLMAIAGGCIAWAASVYPWSWPW